jgi:membrane protein YqaA with SNARE-associated domain
MFIGHAIAALLPTTVGRVRLWLFQLGGLGLIPLGVLDNSLVPLPGTMDAATIVLSARQEQLWLYYAFMATVGTVIGGFVTYRIARKEGKQVLKRGFSSVKVDKVCEIFGRSHDFEIEMCPSRLQLYARLRRRIL